MGLRAVTSLTTHTLDNKKENQEKGRHSGSGAGSRSDHNHWTVRGDQQLVQDSSAEQQAAETTLQETCLADLGTLGEKDFTFF